MQNQATVVAHILIVGKNKMNKCAVVKIFFINLFFLSAFSPPCACLNILTLREKNPQHTQSRQSLQNPKVIIYHSGDTP